MGEMIEYQERLVYEEDYRGYTIYVFSSNLNHYLIVALNDSEKKLVSKIDDEKRSRRTFNMDWYEMCASKFLFTRDMELIPGSIPMRYKANLEVWVMGEGKETYSKIMTCTKFDIDEKLEKIEK